MNKHILRVIYLVIVALMVGGIVLYSPGRPETTTMMIYMIGSDLESKGACATNDLQEMRDSGLDLENVRLLVYTGGSQAWYNDQPEIPVDSNGLFVLEGTGFVPVEEFELASMGTAENLVRFLNYGVENYPADHFDLILWNHGNGPVIGYGMDSLYEQDTLSLSELRSALEASPFGTDNKLDVIGFDACLMASAELACTVGDFADYLVSSQETEPSFGWNYGFLADVGEKSGDDLAVSIANYYMDYCEAYFAEKELFESDVTISAVELKKANELREAINGLFRSASDNAEDAFASLVNDRISSRSFGRATTGSEYDLVDLRSLVNRMQDAYPKETEAVLHLLDEMLLITRSNTDEACGISLYYPFYNKSYYESDWREAYKTLDVFEDYGTYLEAYEGRWLSSDMRSIFADVKVPSQTSDGQYSVELTDDQVEQYASGGYYIMVCNGGDNYSVVFSSPEVELDGNRLKTEYDGNILYFTDDFGRYDKVPIREHDTVDGVTRYSAYPRLLVDDLIQDCEIQFSLDRATGETAINGIYESDTFVKDLFENGSFDSLQSGKRQEIDVSQYDTLMFNMNQGRYMTRDENGVLLDYWSWPADESIFTFTNKAVADGIGFSSLPLYGDGFEYYLMFRYEDVQGNGYCSEPIPIDAAEESQTSEKEILWEGGNCFTLYQGNGVTAVLALIKDPESGLSGMNLLLQNENESTARFSVEINTINGTVKDGNSLKYSVYASPGKIGSEPLDGLNEALIATGAQVPEQLSFSYTVELLTTGMVSHPKQTLDYQRSVSMTLSPELTPAVTVLPWRGAMADSQEIVTIDGVCVRLVYAGFRIENESIIDTIQDMTIAILAENTGPDDKLVSLFGAVIDECWLADESRVVLQPGQKAFLCCSVSPSESVDAWEPEGLIEVGDLSLVLTVDTPVYYSTIFSEKNLELTYPQGADCIYPITLSQAAESTQWVSDSKELIWTNGELELWLADYMETGPDFPEDSEEYSETPRYTWRLWLVNKGETYFEDIQLDTHATINGEDVAESEFDLTGLYRISGRALLPGVGRWYYVSTSGEPECPEIQFSVAIGEGPALLREMTAIGTIRLMKNGAEEVQ